MKFSALFVAAAQAKENYIIGGGVVRPHSEPYILSLQENLKMAEYRFSSFIIFVPYREIRNSKNSQW